MAGCAISPWRFGLRALVQARLRMQGGLTMKHLFALGFLLLTAITSAHALNANALAAMDEVVTSLSSQLPIQLGENVWMTGLRRDGTTLYYTYMVKGIGKAPATREWVANRVTRMCIKEKEYIDEGWRYIDTIVTDNGTLFATTFVDKGICASNGR